MEAMMVAAKGKKRSATNSRQGTKKRVAKPQTRTRGGVKVKPKPSKKPNQPLVRPG